MLNKMLMLSPCLPSQLTLTVDHRLLHHKLYLFISYADVVLQPCWRQTLARSCHCMCCAGIARQQDVDVQSMCLVRKQPNFNVAASLTEASHARAVCRLYSTNIRNDQPGFQRLIMDPLRMSNLKPKQQPNKTSGIVNIIT